MIYCQIPSVFNHTYWVLILANSTCFAGYTKQIKFPFYRSTEFKASPNIDDWQTNKVLIAGTVTGHTGGTDD